jgi:general secretion pathway protein J
MSKGYAKGFTMIEVLIAMTLLSIMVAVLFGSMRISAQSWERGEAKITEVSDAAAVYNFFQRHLSLAIPVSNDALVQDDADQARAGATAENANRNFSFQGDSQSLRFVSTFPASAGRLGLQQFSIQTQQQDNETVVAVALTPFFPVAEGSQWRREEEVLLRHVSGFSLAYFGPVEGGNGSAWQNEWLGKDVQPQLVKISISTSNGMVWPEMVIGVKATGPVLRSGGNGPVMTAPIELDESE